MVPLLHPAHLPSAQHSGQMTFVKPKPGPTSPRASPQPGRPVLTVPCLQAPSSAPHHLMLSAAHGTPATLASSLVPKHLSAPGHWLLLSPLPGTLFLKISLAFVRSLPNCHSLSERHSWATPYKTAFTPPSTLFPYHFIFLHTIYHP